MHAAEEPGQRSVEQRREFPQTAAAEPVDVGDQLSLVTHRAGHIRRQTVGCVFSRMIRNCSMCGWTGKESSGCRAARAMIL